MLRSKLAPALPLLIVLPALWGCKKLTSRGGSPAASVASASVGASVSAGLDAQPPKVEGAGDFGPSEGAPLEFAVGQWSRYRLSQKGQPDGAFTYKVVGGTGTAPDFEVTVESDKGRTDIAMSVTLKDRYDPKTWKVTKAAVKLPGGPKLTLPRSALQRVDQLLGGAIVVIPRFTGPRRDCEAPAGRFSQCYAVTTAAQVLGREHRTTAYAHSSVPILGTVRAEMDDGAVMVLEAFGLTPEAER